MAAHRLNQLGNDLAHHFDGILTRHPRIGTRIIEGAKQDLIAEAQERNVGVVLADVEDGRPDDAGMTPEAESVVDLMDKAMKRFSFAQLIADRGDREDYLTVPVVLRPGKACGALFDVEYAAGIAASFNEQ